MVIGTKIVELRKKYNYTQEALASKLGITRQTLSNWESNITSPDLEGASKLCKALKISITDLLDNNLDVDIKDNSSKVISKLVGREVFLNFNYDEFYDLDISPNKPVKVLNITDDFIKIEVLKGKKKIVKLIDMELIDSITVEE